MKKILKRFKLSYFLPNIIVSGAFPFIFAMRAPKAERLLKFTNALTIVGLIMIIFGVIYHLYLKGDFDITQYLAKRSMDAKNTKPFDAYMEDKEDKKKELFNYPLLVGFLFIGISVVITYTCF